MTPEERTFTVPFFSNPFTRVTKAAVNQHNVEQANAAVAIARAYLDIFDRRWG